MKGNERYMNRKKIYEELEEILTVCEGVFYKNTFVNKTGELSLINFVYPNVQ